MGLQTGDLESTRFAQQMMVLTSIVPPGMLAVRTDGVIGRQLFG